MKSIQTSLINEIFGQFTAEWQFPTLIFTLTSEELFCESIVRKQTSLWRHCKVDQYLIYAFHCKYFFSVIKCCNRWEYLRRSSFLRHVSGLSLGHFFSCTKSVSANGYHCYSVFSGDKNWAQLKLTLNRKLWPNVRELNYSRLRIDPIILAPTQPCDVIMVWGRVFLSKGIFHFKWHQFSTSFIL